jgi:hypothetical protein
MFNYIIKLIVTGTFALGLSAAAMVPRVLSAEANATKEDIANLQKGLEKKIDDQTAAIIAAINNQTIALTNALTRPNAHVVIPPAIPVQPPTRVVHVHRHYYSYWCPPPWFVGY